jgi:hypothetical protein
MKKKPRALVVPGCKCDCGEHYNRPHEDVCAVRFRFGWGAGFQGWNDRIRYVCAYCRRRLFGHWKYD